MAEIIAFTSSSSSSSIGIKQGRFEVGHLSGRGLDTIVPAAVRV
jgi:hypothetical protein